MAKAKKKASKKTAPAKTESVDNEISTDSDGKPHESKAERKARLTNRFDHTK
jgi:hypothetical protein